MYTIIHLRPSSDFFPVDLLTEDLVLLPLGSLLKLAGFAGGLGLAFFSLNVGFLCVI